MWYLSLPSLSSLTYIILTIFLQLHQASLSPPRVYTNWLPYTWTWSLGVIDHLVWSAAAAPPAGYQRSLRRGWQLADLWCYMKPHRTRRWWRVKLIWTGVNSMVPLLANCSQDWEQLPTTNPGGLSAQTHTQVDKDESATDRYDSISKQTYSK